MVKTTARQKKTNVKQRKRFTMLKRLYAYGAVGLLLISSAWWALLGAKLQQANADQLVNSYLFEHLSTFHNATFPSAHTFLFKWPLFFIIKLFGNTSFAYGAVTVLAVLLTIGALIYVVHRIEKRPVIFGSILLALASILLLVPPQSSAGALLPVNMAMLATRNLEYILYISSLVLLARAENMKGYYFWLATILLTLLVASDKLFLFFSMGGAVAALIAYLCTQRWSLVRLVFRWFVMTIIAAMLASGLLWAINASGLTHITTHDASGPFKITVQSKLLVLGSVFSILGTLTNFGANPAYDNGVLAHTFSTAKIHLSTIAAVGYLVNLALFVCAGYFSSRFFIAKFKQPKPKKAKDDKASKLSLMLVWSSLAAIAAFIVTDHYYTADSRYLSICLFAGTIAAATYLRTKRIVVTHKVFKITAVVLCGSVLIGMYGAYQTYQTDKTALTDIQERNALVVAAIAHHPTTLVGDYWRVVPIKQASNQPLSITPLQDCAHPRETLSSTRWQPDLKTHSFAYLLSLDKSLTDFPRCNLDQVTNIFGKPNASTLIKGIIDSPAELLLFYDGGIHPKPTVERPLTTVGPVSLSQLPQRDCSNQTILNIVAHQDDDLLFLNPDLDKQIKSGYCIITVYVTAGDAGSDKLYWLKREQGSQGAYDYMDGPEKDIWVQRTVVLGSHEFISVSNPRNNHKLALIFFHLPDGNLNGSGFKATKHASLVRLESHGIDSIATVDGQSSYSKAQLVQALADLMQEFQPSEIHTQATYSATKTYPDHSDHLAVGRLVQQAYKQASMAAVPIKFYYGYPIRDMKENIGGDELMNKARAFIAYAKFANDVDCTSIESCLQLPTYGSYLKRQYNYSLPN